MYRGCLMGVLSFIIWAEETFVQFQFVQILLWVWDQNRWGKDEEKASGQSDAEWQMYIPEKKALQSSYETASSNNKQFYIKCFCLEASSQYERHIHSIAVRHLQDNLKNLKKPTKSCSYVSTI